MIQPSSTVPNLGFHMDRYNSCEAHAKYLYKKIYFHTNCIGSARCFLLSVTLQSVVTALVVSNLDYCNAILSGATAFQLGRLQQLQNRAARLITGIGIRDHITPVLKELHWLPVELRIHFKVLLYIFKALRGQAPHHLDQLCCYKHRPSHLRQPTDFSLQVSLTQRSATEAAFSVQGPLLWNKLPHDIKTANFVNIFKKKLKTHFLEFNLPS